MGTYNIHDAKTHLSRIIDKVAEGESVYIAKAGKPVARLVPVEKPKGRRKLGLLKGKLRIPSDFDAPLPPEVLRSFERG
jgi:prevent-host-death family protein